jgi:hypothetical protein
MAAKKKSGERKQPEEDSPKGRRGASMGSIDQMLSKDTQMHLFKAGTELAMALDTMLPKGKMPEEAKEHAKAAKKEMLLMMRALIDAKLEGCEKETSKSSSDGLKKIDVE